MATDFGRDMAGTTDLTPTLLDNEGDDLMVGVICRRLYTPNQSLLSSPGERTTDLRQYLSGEQARDGSDTGTIKSDATAALKADKRIFSVTIVVHWEPDEHFMTLDIKGAGATGPFDLTLRVDSVTVERLR